MRSLGPLFAILPLLLAGCSASGACFRAMEASATVVSVPFVPVIPGVVNGYWTSWVETFEGTSLPSPHGGVQGESASTQPGHGLRKNPQP